MKISRILILLILLMLQSCQHNEEAKKDELIWQEKLKKAAEYNTQLGLAYLKQGDRERAKRKLLLALSQDEKSPDVNAAMAYFMEKSGDLTQAEKFYRRAMSLKPGNGAQLNNYGTYLCRQGKFRQSETYFLKAINDVKYEHTAGAYENAGLCVLAINDTEKAAFYFNKALDHDPMRSQSLYELVKLEIKQNNFKQALVDLQKHSELTLKEPEILKLAETVASKNDNKKLADFYKSTLNTYSDTKAEGVNHDYDNG